MSLTARQWYEDVCSVRGHAPSDTVLTTSPPMQICENCGTYYRYGEAPVFEHNVPVVDVSTQ